MKMSTRSQYGLRAIVFLARSGKEVFSLREISKKEKIPFDYLGKIFSRLEKSGLVSSKKGVRGGYFLKKNPSQIKVFEVVKSLEGEISLVKCVNKVKNICPQSKKCLTKNCWQKIQNSLESALNSISLGDLIRPVK